MYDQESRSLSESSQEFLQPVLKMYPANELISKHYAPDQKPILKLITPEKFVVVPSQQQSNIYYKIFDEEDTLGYHLTFGLRKNLVYLKMNNCNYLKLTIKNQSYKFLAGLFVPARKLLAPEVKLHQSLYTALPDLSAREYSNNIGGLFPKNFKPNDYDLKFSSDFQSGNLFTAMKKSRFEYDLILQNDINSKGNIQWFNFVVDFRAKGTYTFNILNFTKSYSQYEKGMRILCYCFDDVSDYVGISGCVRDGQSIQYQQSNVRRQDSLTKNYYSLKFDYECLSASKVRFSYFYPYTSLDLQKFLKKTLYRKNNVHVSLQKIKVCESILGLPVYVFHIHQKRNKRIESSKISPNSADRMSKQTKKNKSVIFMARQHSGETQGSFIVEGVVRMLMENNQMDYLKRNIDFYIFPMVNVDGVYYGNYRTNLSGTDLNRIWRNPRKDLHPQVYYIKKYLHAINANAPISVIIDLHGHSKSLNSFFYGNPPKKDIFFNSNDDTRLFPYVCSKRIKQISFSQCTFRVSEAKKNSARIVLAECFPRALVYTLENSFQGWQKENGQILEYTQDSLRKIGRETVMAYLEYEHLIDKNPQIKEKWLREIQEFKNRQSSCLDKTSPADSGDSDSEAEFDLIDIQKIPSLGDIPEMSIFDSAITKTKSICKLSSILPNNSNSGEKKKIYKNVSQKANRYKKYDRGLICIESAKNKENKENIQARGSQTNILGRHKDSGFLSIIKIKTSESTQPAPKEKSAVIKVIEQRMNQCKNRSSLKLNKQNSVDRLRHRKFKVEDAVSSSSGRKTFLRTMGIHIDHRNIW